MKNFFIRLLRRGKKKEEAPAVENAKKEYPDIIGRQGGQKRNRIHVYCQPYGYPVRLCDWTAIESSKIEVLAKISDKTNSYRTRRLSMLIHFEHEGKGVKCKHCIAVMTGKRHSMGAPLP